MHSLELTGTEDMRLIIKIDTVLAKDNHKINDEAVIQTLLLQTQTHPFGPDVSLSVRSIRMLF